MKAITELALRQKFKAEGIPRTLALEPGRIITPSAGQFLRDHGVRLIREDAGTAPGPDPDSAPDSGRAQDPPRGQDAPRGYEKQARYVSAADGGTFAAKPEHMTQLRGKYLVPKTHPVIRFRGMLDTLQAEILVLIQKHRAPAGWPRNLTSGPAKGLARDLAQLLDRTREILRAEVLDEHLDRQTDQAPPTLLDLTDRELRAHSHAPKKYYGIGHILPGADMGAVLIDLNRLRARVREVELAAVCAFTLEAAITRPDIVQALNRLSSAVYVMMLRQGSGRYAPEEKKR